MVLVVTLAILSGGCSATYKEPGPAGARYTAFALKAVRPEPIETVYTASLVALRRLEILPVEKTRDGLSGLITAYTADNKKITISLDRMPEQTTRITIKVGTLGDRAKSQIIFNKISENLARSS